MSRILPAQPNLDHLKNQAKDLLSELKRRNPESKLADAQHAIAREYGFPSWPKLKAHVESLAGSADPSGELVAMSQGSSSGGGRMTANVIDGPPNYGFYRYTLKAREALFLSRYEASQVGSVTIEPEHVLLGLIRAGHVLASKIFEGAHLSLEHARAAVVASTMAQDPVSLSAMIPFSAATKQIFHRAAEEADRLRHHDIDVAHLLLGILRSERSAATSILKEKGMHLDLVRNDLVRLMNEEPR